MYAKSSVFDYMIIYTKLAQMGFSEKTVLQGVLTRILVQLVDISAIVPQINVTI